MCVACRLRGIRSVGVGCLVCGLPTSGYPLVGVLFRLVFSCSLVRSGVSCRLRGIRSLGWSFGWSCCVRSSGGVCPADFGVSARCGGRAVRVAPWRASALRAMLAGRVGVRACGIVRAAARCARCSREENRKEKIKRKETTLNNPQHQRTQDIQSIAASTMSSASVYPKESSSNRQGRAQTSQIDARKTPIAQSQQSTNSLNW